MERSEELAPAILQLIAGTWSTQLLSTAAELGIADVLKDQPLPAALVAERLATEPSVTYRILRALATLGVLDELEDRRFALTELGSLLRTDVPGSMHALAQMIGRPWHNRIWEVLTKCARSGGSGAEHAFGISLWDYFDQSKDDFDNFNAAMSDAATGMHVTAVEAYDFSGIRKLVDVGGGHGRLLGMILKRYPGMNGILFDRPSLEAGARAELEALGVANRCQFVGGDFLSSVPAGGDAYIMSHILHDWPDAEAAKILKNCRTAIQDGGKLLVLDAVIKPSGERDWGKLMDLEIMLCFGGRDRTAEELTTLLQEARFTLTRVLATRSAISIVEGVTSP